MTRQEEIRQAAAKYAAKEYRRQSAEDKKLAIADFIAGAEWADEHHTWISVEERLPKENGKYYVIVAGEYDMALYHNGKWVTAYKERKNIGEHNSDGITIQDFEFSRTDLTADVTHWIPIPEL